MDNEELRIRFTYHPPKGNQKERYEDMRDLGGKLAELIDSAAPDCREKSLAITKLEEMIMWVNAAIARRT
jgi:hypothetical protein